MESITYMKNIGITPKKLRFFLPSVKKMSPVQALAVLMYTPNKPARIFYKAIQSALANARQTLKVSDDLLQFKTFSIEEGQKLKRYLAGSRGSPNPVKKRYAHIKIILQVKPVVQEKKMAAAQLDVSKDKEKIKSNLGGKNKIETKELKKDIKVKKTTKKSLKK